MNTKGDLLFPSYVFVEKPPPPADPDFNGDGLVTLDDFFMFAERFGAKQGDDFWIFLLAFGQ